MMKKLLIVEDDKDFLWILRQSFNNHGMEIFYAVDGQEGLEKADKERPDLIMIDILLPKMNGIEMAKAIRKKGVDSQMIFLTNFKDAEHISQALDAVGETDYIVKSDMRIDDIVDRVKKKLGI
jgi:two-component system, OmpR family, alkaline phosphatase synthesis response regulator PhoP